MSTADSPSIANMRPTLKLGVFLAVLALLLLLLLLMLLLMLLLRLTEPPLAVASPSASAAVAALDVLMLLSLLLLLLLLGVPSAKPPKLKDPCRELLLLLVRRVVPKSESLSPFAAPVGFELSIRGPSRSTVRSRGFESEALAFRALCCCC